MAARHYQRTPPLMPKIEDDGNPRFVIFIRMANVYLWYPLSIIAGGTTTKIIVAAKDNLLGKYIYKDTIARNIAAVMYRDEKEIPKTAIKQHRVLKTATEFRYGYKLVEKGNMRAAISTSNVEISSQTPDSVVKRVHVFFETFDLYPEQSQLPTRDQLKTVFDKVKDFVGDAKESFRKITWLNPGKDEETEESLDEKAKAKAKRLTLDGADFDVSTVLTYGLDKVTRYDKMPAICAHFLYTSLINSFS